MKSLLFRLGTLALKNWLGSDSFPGSNSTGSLPSIPKLNATYLSEVSRKIARMGATVFLSSLFFVAGIVMSLFSAAESIDSFGYFVTSNVFYTGLFLTLTSSGAIIVNLRALMKLRIDQSAIYLYEPEAPRADPREASFDLNKIAGPILVGLLSGWGSRRRPPPLNHT